MFKLIDNDYPERIHVLKLGHSNKTKFIELLKLKWDKLHEKTNVFKYKIDKLQERVVDGNYLLQLNPDRGSKRRTPEKIDDICQPFDANKFNFNQVAISEVLFDIVENNDQVKHVLIVNVSPISRYHSLLCPSVAECLPQIITEDSIRLALELIIVAKDRDLRIGFNSLCAMASVNHLHYHLFLEPHDLPVETATCKHIKCPLYYLDTYPAPAFCFEINQACVKENSTDIFKLLRHFIDNSIAHNVMITRGRKVATVFKSEVSNVTESNENITVTAPERGVTTLTRTGVFTRTTEVDITGAANSETGMTKSDTTRVPKSGEMSTVTVSKSGVTIMTENIVVETESYVTKVTNNFITGITKSDTGVTQGVAMSTFPESDTPGTAKSDGINKMANSANEYVTGYDKECIRVLIWPRKSSAGVKQLTNFNVAVCELSGWFPVFNSDAYNNLTREDLERELKKWKYDDFDKLCEDVKSLF